MSATPKLDARHFRWTTLPLPGRSVFEAFISAPDEPPKPQSVGEVRFDDATFEQMSYEVNGLCLSYYGSGRVREYSAVRLDNGTVLFCLVSGTQFAGTFQSADDIHMQYYLLTPVEPSNA